VSIATHSSRKKLQEIINFGREKELITEEQARNLTNSVYKNINSMLLSKENPTIDGILEGHEHEIDLSDDKLRQLIMIQEERIQRINESITFKEILYFTGMVLGGNIAACLFLFTFVTVPPVSVFLLLGFLASTALSVASYYSVIQNSPYSLKNTLATLERFNVSAEDSTQTPQISTNENSSKNQSTSEKTHLSSSSGFFLAKPTSSQDTNNLVKQENTSQYRK
jgi:hypothetical protein